MYLNLIYATIMAVTLPWQLTISHNGHACPSVQFISLCLHITSALSESSQNSDANPSFITEPTETALLKDHFMKGNYCACLGPELK